METSEDRRYPTLLWVIGGALFVALGLGSLKGWSDLRTARAREQEVIERIEEARERVRRLEARVESLREDDQALEQVARERLGLAREGEIVIILPEGGGTEVAIDVTGGRPAAPEPDETTAEGAGAAAAVGEVPPEG